MRRASSQKAFTLIELMVTVAIMGVLSAIAIPAFKQTMSRSKTAETSSNLSSMFKSAASYYSAERSGQGNTAAVSGYCTVDDGAPSPSVPNASKQSFVGDASMRAIGFSVGDAVYFSYGLVTATGVGSCGHVAQDTGIYTFYAHGDLDGDGIESLFEMPAGSDGSNVLYHSIGIHIVNETE